MSSPPPSRQDLKRELLARGFQPYRTVGNSVILADRVRDNLIMDSGVSAGVDETLFVRVVLRAEALAFPGEGTSELLARVRALGAPLIARGYREDEVSTVPILDPGDRSLTLDTWHQVTYVRAVASFDELDEELHAALPLEKAAGSAPRA